MGDICLFGLRARLTDDFMLDKGPIFDAFCIHCVATGYWKAGLYAALEDTSIHLYSDDDMVVINDKYPKARYHYLVSTIVCVDT